MRLALLTVDEAPGAAHSNRRRSAGASQLERQVDIALALGCERVFLFAQKQDELAVAAQHLAEQGGAQFRILSRGRQLLGSMRQQDELVVLTEGLVFTDQECLSFLSSGPAILTLPAETGVHAGFERLDRDLAWAGAMVLPGRVLERLDSLPDDFEPVSTLVRAARAARVPERELPLELVTEGKWSLAVPAAKPPKPLATSLPNGGEAKSFLGKNVIDPAARWLVQYESLRAAPLVAGIFLSLGSLAGGYFGHFGSAMLALAGSILCLRCWAQIRKLADAQMFSSRNQRSGTRWLPEIPDAIGIGLLCAALAIIYPLETAVYISILTWLAWTLARWGSARWSVMFEDRELAWLILASGGLLGHWLVAAALVTALGAAGIGKTLRGFAAITRP